MLKLRIEEFVRSVKKSHLEVFMAKPRGKLTFSADSFIN